MFRPGILLVRVSIKNFDCIEDLMNYNKYASIEQIKRYDEEINNDPQIPPEYKKIKNLREVCRAGLWLSDELTKNYCPENIVHNILYIAAKKCHGQDIWETHAEILSKYNDSSLIIDDNLFQSPTDSKFLN